VQRRVLDQFGDQDCVVPQDGLDVLRRGVTAAEPDYFGWHSVEPAALGEIAVLRDNAKVVRFGILPDLIVWLSIESERADMH
jgi:hypothetical protein